MKSYWPKGVGFHLQNFKCNFFFTFDIKFTWETSCKHIEVITTSRDHERVYFERTVGATRYVYVCSTHSTRCGSNGHARSLSTGAYSINPNILNRDFTDYWSKENINQLGNRVSLFKQNTIRYQILLKTHKIMPTARRVNLTNQCNSCCTTRN